MAFYQLNAKSDQRLNDLKLLEMNILHEEVTGVGTPIFLSSFTVTSELSASPGGRCAVTKAVVAEAFVVAGSGLERHTVEAINGTAARSRQSRHGHLQNTP